MDKSNMNSFLEYSICNRPGAGTYSTPKSAYHSHPHHHHHHHHLDHHQGFPVTAGAFHAAPNGPVNGPTDDDTGGANYPSEVRLYAGAGTVGGGALMNSGGPPSHHQHSQNSYHHPHQLHQTQTMPSALELSPYNTGNVGGNNGAYVAVQTCASNTDYMGTSGQVNTTHSNGVHPQYFIDDSSMSSTYYHQSTFPSTTPSQGPNYGALAGAYCGGTQGNLPAAQYPQHLGGGVEAPAYVGLPHGGLQTSF